MLTIIAPMKMADFLKSKGITSSGMLVKPLKISRAQASNIWHGRDRPGIGLLKRMSDALGIPLHELAEVDEVAKGERRQPKHSSD